MLFNATVGVYNPYNNTLLKSISFPGLSGDIKMHLGPALPDASGHLTVLLDAAAPFNTGGADVSGSNILIKYDLTTDKVIWQRNITELVTQGRFGAFQDLEYDRNDNIYVVGSYPGTVLKVDPNGNGLAPFFVPTTVNTTVPGFGSLASSREKDFLLTNNNADGQIYRFDAVSGASSGKPVLVPRKDAGTGVDSVPLAPSDAILMPAKYKGTILLVAMDAVGTAVLRSKDGTWASAETLGTVSNIVPEAMGGMVSAVVQIGPDKIFSNQEFFSDPLVAGTNAGNRTAFPLLDITAQVDAFVASFP